MEIQLEAGMRIKYFDNNTTYTIIKVEDKFALLDSKTYVAKKIPINISTKARRILIPYRNKPNGKYITEVLKYELYAKRKNNSAELKLV